MAGKRVEKKDKKRLRKSDIVLIIICIGTIVFIRRMTLLFEDIHAVPDSVVVGFFAFIGGECGILGWIKNSEEKQQERQWRMEDEQKQERPSLTCDGDDFTEKGDDYAE